LLIKLVLTLAIIFTFIIIVKIVYLVFTFRSCDFQGAILVDTTESLQKKIDHLKVILSHLDTENFIGMAATEFGITMNPSESILRKRN
jgi:hypothetical protein